MTNCPACGSLLEESYYQPQYDSVYGDALHFKVCYGHGFYVEGLGWAVGDPFLSVWEIFPKLFSFSSVPTTGESSA